MMPTFHSHRVHREKDYTTYYVEAVMFQDYDQFLGKFIKIDGKKRRLLKAERKKVEWRNGEVVLFTVRT